MPAQTQQPPSRNSRKPSARRWRTSSRVSLAAVVIAGVVAPATAAFAAGDYTTQEMLQKMVTAVAANNPAYAEFGALNDQRTMLLSEVAVAANAFNVKRTLNGTGVDVALIDTGVAPVLGLNGENDVINGPDLSLDFQSGATVSVDGFGHGTHLAGILASTTGIAPGARILNMKVGAADGAVDVSQVIAAIDWVVANRNKGGLNVRVLALAYGTDSQQVYTSDPLTHAVESAWRNGIFVVTATGNDGAAMLHPAIDPYVMAVGAANTQDPYVPGDDTLATFSSVGSSLRPVDVLAPGVSILSSVVPGSSVDLANPDSKICFGPICGIKGSGTSQAVAVVAGAAALLFQAQPATTPDLMKAALKLAARPIPNVSPAAQGGGVIDVEKSLAMVNMLQLAGLGERAKYTQKFTVSNGRGKLELARGTTHLVATDGTELRGEFDVLGAPWVPKVWAPLSTKGTAWTGGTWNGQIWAGADWTTVNEVSATDWVAKSWRSTIWSAKSWRADLWLTGLWSAKSWRDNTWS